VEAVSRQVEQASVKRTPASDVMSSQHPRTVSISREQRVQQTTDVVIVTVTKHPRQTQQSVDSHKTSTTDFTLDQFVIMDFTCIITIRAGEAAKQTIISDCPSVLGEHKHQTLLTAIYFSSQGQTSRSNVTKF